MVIPESGNEDYYQKTHIGQPNIIVSLSMIISVKTAQQCTFLLLIQNHSTTRTGLQNTLLFTFTGSFFKMKESDGKILYRYLAK